MGDGEVSTSTVHSLSPVSTPVHEARAREAMDAPGPGWCCSRTDGNGFFGDVYFDPDEWLKGLSAMATMFNNTKNVVGMSLRNELRGPKQNVSLWYRYMQMGAEAVHAANPNVLVILSGLDFDNTLSFLFNEKVHLSFSGKLVYEQHWYGFSDGGNWETQSQNDVCGMVVDLIWAKGLFLLQQGWPLFFSEFGFDMSGTHIGDNRYLTCFLSVAAEMDLDWSIWALQGSYYIREGILAYDESYDCYHGTGVQLEILVSLKGSILSNHHSKVLVFQTLTSRTT